MLTGLLDSLLKLEFHACFKKIEQWFIKVATAMVALHSVLAQKSEIILKD